MSMVVTERRRKSRPRLPVESDGAQADEEPLAGSRVRIGTGTGLANLDTGTTRWRSVVVSSASSRSLIEDDEGRRHSRLV